MQIFRGQNDSKRRFKKIKCSTVGCVVGDTRLSLLFDTMMPAEAYISSLTLIGAPFLAQGSICYKLIAGVEKKYI